MGFRRVQKSTPSLLIEGSNLSTSVRLEILYSLDGGDWVEWGSATENGFTELTFPGGLHTQEFKYMQIKVNFITGTATETPILEGLTLRFLMRPEVAFGWNVNLPAAGNLTHGEGEDPRSAQKILSDLKEARNSKAPVRFKDLDGLEYYVYLTSISSQAVERQLNQDTPIQGGIEKLVNINLIEAK
jgi:hypothetical protein